MALLHFPRRLVLVTVPPPEDGGEQVEGIVPYAQLVSRYSYVVGTGSWVGALQAQFDGTPTTDALEAYRTSLVEDGYLMALFPRGFFLDSLDQFAHGGSPADNSQTPVDILVKPWEGEPFLLNQFLGQPKEVYNLQALPQRVEVEWVKQQAHGFRGTFPSQLRPIGLYPADLTPFLQSPTPDPQPLGPLFGVCSNWYYFDTSEEQAKILVYAGVRDYWEVYNSKLDDGLIHNSPSFNADRSGMMDVLNTHSRFYIPSYNNNFLSNRASFTTGGVLDEGAWHNGMVAKGADKLNPETWREWGEFLWQQGAREGSVTHPTNLLQQATEPRFPGDVPVQTIQTGMGRLRKFTIGNEWIKDFDGLRSSHVTGEEGAVAWMVCYNGYNNTMGPTCGWHNADPSLKVGLGLSFSPTPGNALAFFRKLGEIGGTNPDGTNLIQPAYWEIHDYLRGTNGQGIPFELSDQPKALDDLRDILRRYSPTTKLVMGEYGYTGHPEAYGVLPDGTYTDQYSYLPAAHGFTAEERRASITFMNGVFLARWGVQLGCLYQDYDQAEPAFGVAWDKLCGYTDTLFYQWLQAFLPLLQDHVPTHLSNPTLDPTHPYVFTLEAPGKPTYYLLYATGAATFSVNLPTAGTLLEFDRSGGTSLLASAHSGQGVSVSELPVLFRAA